MADEFARAVDRQAVHTETPNPPPVAPDHRAGMAARMAVPPEVAARLPDNLAETEAAFALTGLDEKAWAEIQRQNARDAQIEDDDGA